MADSLSALRERYRRAKKHKGAGSGLALAKARAVSIAKADARARRFIERWMAGETHAQIAAAEGLPREHVSQCIAKYRRRHPDARVPCGINQQKDA